MSLTSLLLGSKATIDTDLDNLFATTQVPPAAFPSSSSTTGAPKKRKILPSEDALTNVTPSPKKRARRDTQTNSQLGSHKAGRTDREKEKKQKEVKHEADNDVDSDSDNSDLEKAYASKSTATSKSKHEVVQTNEEDDAIPVHETLVRGTKQRVKATKRKHILEDETPEMRDRRTIFVGNLPLEVLSKRPLKKQLQKHILSFVPTAKIESIRFRSIPFQVPTTKLPDANDDDEDDPKTSKKEPRTHAKQRASSWRTTQGDKDEGMKTDDKKYLTPAQKKKIAYIHQEFHTTADVVNAYIVFAHPKDAAERPANLPPLSPTMDPYHAATQAAVDANGSPFMDRVLRVDLIGKANRKTVVRKAGEEEEEISIPDADPRLSVFVGNLDFAGKEEDLRAFFEALMRTERGAPVNTSGGEISDPTRKPLTWVTRVRIVRDNATQLGRGFAYVEFMDKQCVDEILAMEESKLKFAKRKLRVQRCKGGAGMKQPAPQARPSAKAEKSGYSVGPTEAVFVPKGDPFLGEKLVGLSKEERKHRKSTDPDRVARRLAKKKLRMAMGPQDGKVLKKERNRVRSKVKKT